MEIKINVVIRQFKAAMDCEGNMKRLLSILLFSLLCLSLYTRAADQRVNLAGTWILDIKNSDPFFRSMPNPGAPQLGSSPGGADMGGGTRGLTPAIRDMDGGFSGPGMPNVLWPTDAAALLEQYDPFKKMGGEMVTKSADFGTGPQSTAPNAPMVIEQNEKELRISRTGTIMGKAVPVFESYVLDGAEHTQTTQMPGSPDPVKVVTSAKLKKNSLLVRITTYSPKNKGELEKEFSLSKDGKILTVKSSRRTPTGDMIQDQIYHKE